jgi:hypothetical protein
MQPIVVILVLLIICTFITVSSAAIMGSYYRRVEDQTPPAGLGDVESFCKLRRQRGDSPYKSWCFQIAAFFRIAVPGGVLVRYCVWFVYVL